jgi:hypothetical protein
LHDVRTGARWASTRGIRHRLVGILAALAMVGALGAAAPAAHAASYRVVIVVGPVGSQTSNYRYSARLLAGQARTYGATVSEIFSPNATWAKVASVSRGANVLIYLGHGNGWPSPYAPFSTASKDGMGLNASAGNGDANVKYFGEVYMARLGLAPNAVVMLNRMCYASGDSEWGAANPTKATAIKRVDNYGAGFLRSGAKAVFASGITSIGYVLRGLFRGSASMTMAGLFWTDPSRTGSYKFSFASVRTPGATARMDPYAPGRYYRSVIGWLGMTVGAWRAG